MLVIVKDLIVRGFFVLSILTILPFTLLEKSIVLEKLHQKMLRHRKCAGLPCMLVATEGLIGRAVSFAPFCVAAFKILIGTTRV